MRRTVWAATVSMLAYSAPAYAQEAPPAEAIGAQDQAGLEEIIVTAQKREQRLQDVPVAVTALTAEALESRGIVDVSAVAAAVPSLTITQSNNPSSNSINIRGIGTNAFSTGVEPAVAVIVDDVALLQQAQAFSGLTDIERIEVLRGPQGTLFGKGASAGVVNITSRGASRTFEAGISTQVTTDSQYRVDGVVAGPVTSWLGVRANVFRVYKDGYLKNLADGGDLGSEDSVGGRVRLDLTPSSRFNLSLIAGRSRNITTQTRTFRYLASPDVRIFAVQPFFAGDLLAPGLEGITPGTDNYTVRNNVLPRQDSDQSLYIARAELDIGFASLLSVTAYQDWTLKSTEDVDATDLVTVAGNSGGVWQNSDYYARQFSQELRLVSSGSGPFSYVVGLYYANGKTDRTFQRFAFGGGAQKWDSVAGTKSYAIFSQATLDVTPTTHIDAGIRANREEISVRFTDLRSNATVATCAATCNGDSSDDQITYKVALRQDLSDDVMVYASYATGYKGQGYDVSSGFTQSRADNPVAPEHSKAYEVGLKGKFLDNKVQMNLAGFWTDYEDFQTQTAAVVGGVPTFQLANAPRLRSRGVEAELSMRPIRALRLDASATYTDAVIKEWATASCYPGQPYQVGSEATTQGICFGPTPSSGVQNLAGKRLANAPAFKYTVAGTYDVALPSLPFDGFLQADWTHQSSVNYDVGGNPNTFQKGYGILNASIGINGRSEHSYQISLFANNLLDQRYATQIQVASGTNTAAGVSNAGLATVQVLPRESRRYFGIRARFRY